MHKIFLRFFWTLEFTSEVYHRIGKSSMDPEMFAWISLENSLKIQFTESSRFLPIFLSWNSLRDCFALIAPEIHTSFSYLFRNLTRGSSKNFRRVSLEIKYLPDLIRKSSTDSFKTSKIQNPFFENFSKVSSLNFFKYCLKILYQNFHEFLLK